MTIEDIKKIIATDETRTLELKKSTGELKDGMHSACAFLNTDGGWLFLGIAPTSLKILGQQVTENTRKEIAQAIRGLEPAIDVPIKYIEVPDRPGNFVIAMHFDGWVWGMKPFTFHGCPYIRIESTTSVMPPEIYEERLRECRPMEYAWENLTTLDATLDDIDENRVMGIVRAGIREGRMPETANVGETNGETNGGTNNKLESLTKRQISIIQCLRRNNSHTSRTLSALLEISQRTVEREISFLRRNGFIDKEGSTKNGVWKVLQ